MRSDILKPALVIGAVLGCCLACPTASAEWGSIRAENHAPAAQSRGFQARGPGREAQPAVRSRPEGARQPRPAPEAREAPRQNERPGFAVEGRAGERQGERPEEFHGERAPGFEPREHEEQEERDRFHEGLGEEGRNAYFWYGYNPGMIINTLPPDYAQIYAGGNPYYYDQGVFYQSGPYGYIVVAPPIGAVVPALPPGAETIPVGPTPYYYAGGAFYVQSPQGFVVVAPPLGVTVDALPPGAVPVTINGMVYYQADGAYFMPQMEDGVTVYTTVQP